MASFYPASPRQSRPFICTPYVSGPDGRLVATMPDRCPTRACSPCTRADCDLRTAYYRHRKTGPGHSLAVVHCRTHGAAYTLYPPGYAPYRRQSVLRLAHDGSPILHPKGRDAERADFDGTLFESALDARDGVAWARDSDKPRPPERYWPTQGRHLSLAARITGVARELGERVRVSIAMVLSVDCLGLHEGARATGYRAIGKAICTVLAKLRGQACRALDLLRCGALVGSWGEPLHWDADRRVLERAPFPTPGTRGEPGAGDFPRLPTKMGPRRAPDRPVWSASHERSSESFRSGPVPLRGPLPGHGPPSRR
jgi:hypothetical protein